GAALGYLWGPNNDRLLRLAARATLAGAVCLFITSWLRLFAQKVVPVMSGADSLNLFVMLVAITAFAVCAKPRRQALLSFYLPPLALIALLCATLAVQEFRQPAAKTEFSQVFLVIHVSMAFLAYALFFVASMTSAAYAFQARRLKNRQTTGLFQKLPSLENLDHTLFRLIKIGYPLFAVTLVLGLLYAWKTPDPLSSTWWLSPKILLSLVMVLLYGGSYHARALGLLRGPKLAYLVFGGFTVLLVTYLVMVVLHVTNYNFYGTA
ncbi:MAG: cytochrome c biogenesis protein CcsA, partial [Candidatus Hydrogenedentes bacterium]|nr:cytochrome c biogenesis protein CcsA [Candidatus Hydrogenedentota bacterium]